MKRLITVLLVVFMLALSVRVVLAGGDKVRGEEGLGLTTQTCIAPNYYPIDPESPCPYGDYEPSVTPPAYE